MSELPNPELIKPDYEFIELVLNAILVEEGVRNAMLVQPQDYNDTDHNGPNTKHKLKQLLKLFPKLHQTTKYDVYQGIIISKKDYTNNEITLDRMGEILSYPCYAGFADLDRNNTYYQINLNVLFKNGIRRQLLANICGDLSKRNEFETMATSATQLFTEKYSHILLATPVESVYVDIETRIPLRMLIDKMIGLGGVIGSGSTLTPEEKHNIFEQLEFKNTDILRAAIDFDNPFHRGIVVNLLLAVENDPLSVFFPLTQFPNQYYEIEEILTMREKTLLSTLERTRSHMHIFHLLEENEKPPRNKKKLNLI